MSFYEQGNQLPEFRKEFPEYATVNAAVLQNVVRRVDKAFRAFFRRLKIGQKPGYPRFKTASRYRSFTHPQASRAKWRASHLYLPSFGWIRWRPPAQINKGVKVKTITVVREADGWYAVLSCEVPRPEPLTATGNVVGIDLGLKNLVALSDGNVLGDLEHLKAVEKRIRLAHKNADRKKKGSNRWRKAVQALARKYQNLERARKDQLHKISTYLVQNYDVICIEDLNVQQLINLGSKGASGRGLRRNFRHAAFGTLISMLSYKAEEAGRALVKVDPRGTSQTCPECGSVEKKVLKQRRHNCVCGCSLDRDHAAALIVLQRGLREPFVEGVAMATPSKREVGKQGTSSLDTCA
jgi:putative transposase